MSMLDDVQTAYANHEHERTSRPLQRSKNVMKLAHAAAWIIDVA